jgi:hypothetical protein
MLLKRRLHGIELLDNPRCPRVIRDGATDYLQFIIRKGNAYGPVVPVLARLLSIRNRTHIVDLCSGGGGPWPDLRAQLVRAGVPATLEVQLTDAFPNTSAFSLVTGRDAQIRGEPVPVDIEHNSVTPGGVRTLFSSFHHFRPATAQRVLRNLVQHGDEIFIAEITERRLASLLFMLLAPMLVWLATPALRPVKVSRFVLTYLLPVIPFVVCFDGIVSCFRTYSPAELRELLTTMKDLPYDWEVGQLRGKAPMAVTYVAGVPRNRAP